MKRTKFYIGFVIAILAGIAAYGNDNNGKLDQVWYYEGITCTPVLDNICQPGPGHCTGTDIFSPAFGKLLYPTNNCITPISKG